MVGWRYIFFADKVELTDLTYGDGSSASSGPRVMSLLRTTGCADQLLVNRAPLIRLLQIWIVRVAVTVVKHWDLPDCARKMAASVGYIIQAGVA